MIGGNLLAHHLSLSMTAHVISTLAGSFLGAWVWADEYLHSDSYIERLKKVIPISEREMRNYANEMMILQEQMENIQDKLMAKTKEYQEKMSRLKTVEEKAPVEALCKKVEIEKRKVALILNDFALTQLQGKAPQFA